MRRSLLLFIAAMLGFISLSCEEDFNPKTDFREEQVLSCIIATKSQAYSAYLTNLYDAEGTNPMTNHTDPVISGAQVTMLYNGKTFLFREDTLRTPSGDRYGTNAIVYRGTGDKIGGRDSLYIIARLPNGKVLRGATRTPDDKTFELSYPFASGFSTKINQFLWGTKWQIDWIKTDDNLFIPKLYAIYTLDSASIIKQKQQELPMRYVKKGDARVPIYPLPTRASSIQYDYSAIDSAVAALGKNLPDKSKIKLMQISFTLVELDEHLTKYYLSTNGYLDQFSIRIDETVYGNVKNGLGIVASYNNNQLDFRVKQEFAQMFGYSFD